jgi:hypothetical protein
MEYIKLLNKEPLVDFKLSSKFKWFNETGFKLNLFEIDSDLTERLINANKLNSSKLTAFLTTIAFYALNDLYTENNIRIPKGISLARSAQAKICFPIPYCQKTTKWT